LPISQVRELKFKFLKSTSIAKPFLIIILTCETSDSRYEARGARKSVFGPYWEIPYESLTSTLQKSPKSLGTLLMLRSWVREALPLVLPLVVVSCMHIVSLLQADRGFSSM